MADAVVLDRWDGTSVRLGTVVDTLIDLRRAVARTASRVWVMTLVVVATTDGEAYQATEAMRALGTHHPARVLVLRPQPSHPDGDGVDAQVTVYGAEADAHKLSFDQIMLTVRGEPARHLDSIVEPFTLSDLPVVVWYPGNLPAVSEPLLNGASAVLVDTKDAHDIAGLITLAGRRATVDLSWMRLRPWREMVASLFDPPLCRPFVARISSVEVAGKEGPRRLLAGWLRSRLAVPADHIRVADARHARIVLRAGDTDRFEVGRDAGERVVRARATVGGTLSHQLVMPLPDDSLAWSLGEALTHLGRDPVWQQALAGGVAAGVWG